MVVCTRGRGLGTGTVTACVAKGPGSPPMADVWVLMRLSPAVVAGRGLGLRVGCGGVATLLTGVGVSRVGGADRASDIELKSSSSRAINWGGENRPLPGGCALPSSAVLLMIWSAFKDWLCDCRGFGLYGGGLTGCSGRVAMSVELLASKTEDTSDAWLP